MDIFNAASKQIDSTQHYSTEHSSTAKSNQIQEKQKVQQDLPATGSKIKNEQNKKAIQEHLNNTLKKLNNQMGSLNINIKFGFNDKIDTLFVDVTERSTGKLIRTIPSKEAMKLAEKMKEIIGMIFDKKG